MKQVIRATVALAVIASLVGCAAHTHVVGRGGGDPDSGRTVEKRQWYILWGLLPLNEVNTDEMVGQTTDYTIETKQSIIDVVIGVVIGWTSIHSRTVTVETSPPGTAQGTVPDPGQTVADADRESTPAAPAPDK